MIAHPRRNRHQAGCRVAVERAAGRYTFICDGSDHLPRGSVTCWMLGRPLACPRVSGSCVALGVSAHDGLDHEPCRECGCDRDAQEPSELAVSGGIRVRSDDPPQGVPEGKSYECCEAGHNRGIDQPPPQTRERGTTADYSEIGTRHHQEGKHSAGEQAHREQYLCEEVPLPDSLIEAYCGTERK